MPLYTYTCATHGEFEAWGKMSESDAPMPCPTCSAASPRALARPMIAKGAGEAGGSDDVGCGMEGCGMGACGMDGGSDGGHVCGAGCVH
jgi:putative FmdB family regulatory protein